MQTKTHKNKLARVSMGKTQKEQKHLEMGGVPPHTLSSKRQKEQTEKHKMTEQNQALVVLFLHQIKMHAAYQTQKTTTHHMHSAPPYAHALTHVVRTQRMHSPPRTHTTHALASTQRMHSNENRHPHELKQTIMQLIMTNKRKQTAV